MCGLCGIFGSDDHWSATSVTKTPSADPIARRHARAARIKVVNQFLHGRRLVLSDWQGATYLVQGPTGAQAIVSNISEIWPVLEREFGGVFDPLDPANFPVPQGGVKG